MTVRPVGAAMFGRRDTTKLPVAAGDSAKAPNYYSEDNEFV